MLLIALYSCFVRFGRTFQLSRDVNISRHCAATKSQKSTSCNRLSHCYGMFCQNLFFSARLWCTTGQIHLDFVHIQNLRSPLGWRSIVSNISKINFLERRNNKSGSNVVFRIGIPVLYLWHIHLFYYDTAIGSKKKFQIIQRIAS